MEAKGTVEKPHDGHQGARRQAERVEIWIEDNRGVRCTHFGLRKLTRERHLPQYPVPGVSDSEGAANENPQGPRADYLGRKPAQHADTATISRGSAGDPRATSHDGAGGGTGDGPAHEARRSGPRA